MMPTQRGQKRKQTRPSDAQDVNGDEPLPPPDRETWPGWVEMESEPALFNVMLKELGVRDIQVREIFSLDEEHLCFLPRPIHALIFLFKYKASSDEGTSSDCPKDVWFANQIPDFACGTVALLNIINNIPGLEMGKELREFRDFTRDMEPFLRGEAIDGFEFVRKIHNSFARESDMLNADALMRDKMNKFKRQQASVKAKETREARKALSATAPPQINGISAPTRISARIPNAGRKSAQQKASNSGDSSSLSDPPDSDEDFKASKPSKSAITDLEPPNKVRRSGRQPKARTTNTFAASVAAEDAEDGTFHFIAYMPINGRVWKLDGMDRFPQPVGTWTDDDRGAATPAGDWMDVVAPALRTRMALHAADGIEFNLMAIVPDPLAASRAELAKNARALCALGARLDAEFPDWRALDGAETAAGVVTRCSSELGLSQLDIEKAPIPVSVQQDMEQEADVTRLVALWRSIIEQQGPLRGAVRDAQFASTSDQEEARHRRHEYGAFVKGWLTALAENELLAELLSDA